MLQRILERLFGLTRLDAVYDLAMRIHVPQVESMMQTITRALDLRLIVSRDELRQIPAEGPLIVVANHPTGAMEGIALSALLDGIRPDSRTLSHNWFKRYPRIVAKMFPVDPSKNKAAIRANRKTARKAISWVNDGGLLTLYPAGEVARFDFRSCAPKDPIWRTGAARIVHATEATVVPVNIEGSNSALFYALSALHPRLGALLLIFELFRQRGKPIRARIGEPIPFNAIPPGGKMRDTVQFLRQSVDALAGHPTRTELLSGNPESGRQDKRARNEPQFSS
jgi:putative hemolysin